MLRTLWQGSKLCCHRNHARKGKGGRPTPIGPFRVLIVGRFLFVSLFLSSLRQTLVNALCIRYPFGLPSWNRALFPRLCPAVAMSKFRSQQRKKPTRSLASERPWQADTPFGPPHIPSSQGNGIDRLRNTLSKLSPAARAERELLKQKSRYKNPLTERNVNTLVSQQEVMDACYPTEHSTELQVTIWLERMN